MSALTDKIVAQALLLPSNEQIALVEKLLTSLNLPIQENIDALWSKEAEKRVKEISDGDVQPIPGEDVFTEIRTRLKK